MDQKGPRKKNFANSFSSTATVTMSALINGVMNVFLRQFGISGLLETSCMDFMFASLVFLDVLKKLRQLFRRMLRHRFAAKLQKYSVDAETSPEVK